MGELSDSAVSSTFGSSYQSELAKVLVALGGGGLALVGIWFRRPPKKCRHCQNPLQKMSKSQLSSHLSNAQRVAINIGSAHYNGWQCSNCDFSTIQRHQHWFKGYTECDRCQEPTLMFSRQETLTHDTRYQSGEAKVTRVCQCCNHIHTELITLARLSTNSHSSSVVLVVVLAVAGLVAAAVAVAAVAVAGDHDAKLKLRQRRATRQAIKTIDYA